MLGRWTRSTDMCSGTTGGSRAAASTSATAAWRCTVTGSISRRRTTIWSRWTQRQVRSAGTRKSPTSPSNISRRRRLWWLAITCWRARATIWTRRDSCSRSIRRRASLDAARHGGAQVWIPGSYDPATQLYIFGTGNPTPAYTAMLRAPRDEHTNLYTCSVVALNVDTGKLAWYYQTSPNDTHDWDATQAPVLFDGMFAGKPRK